MLTSSAAGGEDALCAVCETEHSRSSVVEMWTQRGLTVLDVGVRDQGLQQILQEQSI